MKWLLLIASGPWTFCVPGVTEYETLALCREAKAFYEENNRNGLTYRCQPATEAAAAKREKSKR